jgi:cytochrome c
MQHASAAAAADGQSLFRGTCGACHAVDHRLVGPPLKEIAQLYAGKPEGIVAWARAPGKKRAGFPQMPPFGSMGDARLRQIAEYMLEAGSSR